MADQWAFAGPMDQGWWSTGVPYHFENHYGEQSFSADPVDDPPPGMTGYGQCWRTVTPADDLQFNMEIQVFQAADTAITGIWSRPNDSWTTIVAPTAPAFNAKISTVLSSGVTYFVMFASGDPANPAPGIVWWVHEIPLPAVVTVPPMRIDVAAFSTPAPTDSGVPPIVVHVGSFPGAVSTDPVPFDGSIEITRPVPNAELPTNMPEFVVAVTSTNADALYTVVVQYADNQAMDNPTALTGTTDAVTGGVTLTPASPVYPVTYWRTRLEEGPGVVLIDWSPVFAFTTVDPNAPPAVQSISLPVTWNVDAAAARPIHMWHFDPAGPLDGDVMTIYGQGLPDTGTLTYGEIVLPTTGWQLVAEAPENADDATRVIDGSTVTCEHYEVGFVAPVDDGPGDALVLEG